MKKILTFIAVIATAVVGTVPADEGTALDAVRAEIVTHSGRVALQISDGLFDRAFIPESRPTKIHVTLPELVSGAEVSIAAPNGGQLARRDGKLRFTPQQVGAVELDLEFTPTLGRGIYTIAIRQAGALVTLDLWAGESNPVGCPGPAYVPIRNPEPESLRVSASPWLGQDFRMAGRQLVP